MSTKFSVFISSKMVELATERQTLHELLPMLGNALVKLKGWVFEDDAPASNQTIREVYLDALKHSQLYIGVFWNEYGEWTIDEFQRATEWGIDRHIYVKNVETGKRDPRLQTFLASQSDVVSGITPKWFTTTEDLCEQVRKSVAVWLQDRLQRRPGDSSAILAEFSDDIPELPKKLVGREDLVRQALEFLDEGSRVLLQGFGGMGKTALASTIAAKWLDDSKGSVLWLRVGSDNTDTLLEALSRPFDNQREVSSATGNDKLRAVRKLLAESGISLIILDDVWDGTALSQVIKAVPRTIPMLVTARQRYAMDEILEVGKLPPEKAVELLGYYVRQDYQNDLDAQELCRQVGYHAFALEVAGKTLKVDRIRPGEMLKRIVNAPHNIAMPEDFAEEGRTSIQELLDASLYALDEKSRQVFLGFGGLFVGSTTPELMMRCLDQDKTEIEEALTTLQRRGLAERSTTSQSNFPRYYVHDLAYSYAKAITLQQSNIQQKTLKASLDFVTAYADELDALDAERGNIFGAAQMSHDTKEMDSLIQIMKCLIGTYLAARGHTLQFLELLDAAIMAAEELGENYDETRHFLLSRRGNAYYDRRDLPHTQDCWLQALDLAKKLNMQDRVVILLCGVGKVRADQGQEDAEDYLDQAAQLANAMDDDFLRTFVLEYMGYYSQSKGDYEATRDIFAEEVTIAERNNDTEVLYYALLNLGHAEKDLGHPDRALAHHQRAMKIAEEENNHIKLAHALQAIGEDYLKTGQHDLALQQFEVALPIFRESGLKHNITEIEGYLKSIKE